MLDRVISSRPYIEVDGDQPELMNALLTGFTMTETLCGPVQVELRLSNAAHHAGAGATFAFEFTETETLPLGKAFRVLFPSLDPAAEDRTPREIFAGRVSALEFVSGEDGQPELWVQGEDALMAWRMRRRTRVFDQDTVAAMLTSLAAGDALARPVIDYLNDPTPHRHQVNESDLAFLQRLLADHDAVAQVVDGTLQIGPRADLHRGDITLELGLTLISVQATADLAHQRSRVSLSGWDGIDGEAFRAEMTTAALGPGQGRAGVEYLEPFGNTAEHLAGAGVPDQTTGDVLINAHGAARARRFVVARGEAIGNPALRVGAHLTLEGIGARFSNTYQVVSTCHRFDTRAGYITEFEAECAYFNGEAAT